jgi:KDO2-lipid IV(A) lauroyltransferase
VSVRFRHRIEFGAFWLVFQLTRPLPRRALLAVGRGIGAFVWRVVRFRRKVVLDNLSAAFGAERSARWIAATAGAFYRNLGMMLVEFLAAGHRDRADLRTNVALEGHEYVEALLAAGRGAILMSGHLGNFELMLPRAAVQGYPVHGIVKPQSNRLIDAFYNGIRAREGVGLIRTGGAMQRSLEVLAGGGFVGLLGDQDAGAKGQFVEFLGRPASVNRGPALMAVKAQCPIVMAFVTRRPDGSHLLRVEPPLEVDPAWTEEEGVRIMTERHTALLAAAVRRDPDQYYWIHRRWKTQPPT